MFLALLPTIISLLTKVLDILTSEQMQAKLKEFQNEKRTNDARKALLKNDAAHVAALMADQHDRVLSVCGGSGRGNDSGQRPAVGSDESGQ